MQEALGNSGAKELDEEGKATVSRSPPRTPLWAIGVGQGAGYGVRLSADLT